MQAGEDPIELESEVLPPATDVADPVCAFLLENGRLKAPDLKRAQSYQEQHGGADT